MSFSIDKTQEIFQKKLDASIEQLISKRNLSDQYSQFLKNVINQVNVDPKRTWIPHVNGWYYINMVSGTWVNHILNDELKDYTEFSPNRKELLEDINKLFGSYIKDIDPPQINIEHETISGRTRNINYPTRLTITSEMSLTLKDNANLDMFKYHELWRDYIDAYKKGFGTSAGSESYADESYFIDIPYSNAVWVAIFRPFTMELNALIKIMGVAPTTLPLKEIIGQRATPQATTYTMNYKANDLIMQVYGREQPEGNFYEEFLEDQMKFF